MNKLGNIHAEKLKKIIVVIVAILLIGVLLLLFFVNPKIKEIPDNFNYEAEILSLDNFYNESIGNFSGEQMSKTKFSYETISKKDGILIIKNSFDVRQANEEKIFSVERLYGIDEKTGEHAKDYGDEDRNGYLFAPKEIKKGENYTYWHINYNNPAIMKFQEEGYLYGL